MLQKPCGLLLHQLRNHVAKNSSNSVESFICGTNIVETMIVKQYLLNNKDCNRLAELRAGFHDPKAQWDNLGCQEEVDHIGGIVFNKSTNNTKRGQSKIFEWS